MTIIDARPFSTPFRPIVYVRYGMIVDTSAKTITRHTVASELVTTLASWTGLAKKTVDIDANRNV